MTGSERPRFLSFEEIAGMTREEHTAAFRERIVTDDTPWLTDEERAADRETGERLGREVQEIIDREARLRAFEERQERRLQQ